MEREAHYENRIYFFTLLEKRDTEIKIRMYNTEYNFRKEEKVWRNNNNKMNMVQGLINEVIAVVFQL